MKINFKNPKFIFSIRTIGVVILLSLAIDIIFFNHKYISNTFIGNGITVGIAIIMAQYEIDYKKKSTKEILLIVLSILVISSILYYFWYK